MAAFLSPALLGLLMALIGGALALGSAIGFGTQPNRRSAIGFLLSAALCVGGWLLLAG